jgi:hypothetical protein
MQFLLQTALQNHRLVYRPPPTAYHIHAPIQNNYPKCIASIPEQAVTPQKALSNILQPSSQPARKCCSIRKALFISNGHIFIWKHSPLPNIHQYPPRLAFLKYRNAVPPGFYFSSHYPIINPSTSKPPAGTGTIHIQTVNAIHQSLVTSQSYMASIHGYCPLTSKPSTLTSLLLSHTFTSTITCLPFSRVLFKYIIYLMYMFFFYPSCHSDPVDITIVR